jgi:hypothetical protein
MCWDVVRAGGRTPPSLQPRPLIFTGSQLLTYHGSMLKYVEEGGPEHGSSFAPFTQLHIANMFGN